MTFRFWPTVIFLAAVLFAIELVFLPRAGIQADEVLFVTPFFKGANPLYSWHVGAVRIPVMIMDYIGALKTWLCWPIFRVWPAPLWQEAVWSIRLPACLISVATLVVFADTVRRIAGTGIALAAAAFLATDASYVLTNVYDWGPVALLLLATVSFLNLLRRYAESRRARYLGAAFLIAGLATWYKAVFVFPLAGMLLALGAVWFREARAWLSRRTAGVAAICFAAGVFPLIAFNVTHAGATVAATAYLDPASVGEKTLMMRRTLEGRALEHYMFRSYPHERIALNGAPLADLIPTWYRGSRLGPGSALPLLMLVSLLALPFLRKLESFPFLVFAWIASGAVFCLMLYFRDAGAGPHHTVLVYPGPQFLVAMTLAGMARRIPKGFCVVIAVGIALVVTNLWVLDRYYSEARQNGFSVYWTDAGRPLTKAIQARNLPVAFLDWGIRDVVRVESGDAIPLAPDGGPRPGVLYVGHCAGYVVDQAQTSRFEQGLALSGLLRTGAGSVSDLHGEAMFCLAVLGKRQAEAPAPPAGRSSKDLRRLGFRPESPRTDPTPVRQ